MTDLADELTELADALKSMHGSSRRGNVNSKVCHFRKEVRNELMSVFRKKVEWPELCGSDVLVAQQGYRALKQSIPYLLNYLHTADSSHLEISLEYLRTAGGLLSWSEIYHG